MIVSMPTTARAQQRYDHRLRDLVQRTGDVTVATDLGVPRSTARGWLGAAPTVVVCLDVVPIGERNAVPPMRSAGTCRRYRHVGHYYGTVYRT